MSKFIKYINIVLLKFQLQILSHLNIDYLLMHKVYLIFILYFLLSLSLLK
jgi:hypothetical protein